MLIAPNRTAPKRTRRFSPALLMSAITVVIIAGVAFTVTQNYLHRTTPHGNGPTSSELKEEAKTNAQEKEQAIEHPVTGAPSPAPANSTISFSTHQETDSTVTATANLGNIADGSCTLTVTNNGTTKTYTADVIYQPQYSTCAGFSIPISDVGAGNWALTLQVTSAGVTATKTSTVEIK